MKSTTKSIVAPVPQEFPYFEDDGLVISDREPTEPSAAPESQPEPEPQQEKKP